MFTERAGTPNPGRFLAFVIVAATLVVAGCDQRDQREQQRAAPQPVVAPATPEKVPPSTEARNIFTSRCSACHGPSGEGNGPGAAALTPKPRSFKDPTWQASVDDDRLSKVIVGGGPAVQLSPSMPGNPDLKDKPEVVTELVRIVRQFKQ